MARTESNIIHCLFQYGSPIFLGSTVFGQNKGVFPTSSNPFFDPDSAQ